MALEVYFECKKKRVKRYSKRFICLFKIKKNGLSLAAFVNNYRLYIKKNHNIYFMLLQFYREGTING